MPPLTPAEQALWVLSSTINNRGFYVDRKFAEAARRIAQAAAPEINAEIAEITGGTVTVEGLGTDSLQGDLAYVDVLEHMGCTVVRTADATTAADALSDMPYFASALLGHSKPRITDEHYKQNSSLNAQHDYAKLIQAKLLGH